MVCLSRQNHCKFFNGCLPQILLSPFLKTLSEIKGCTMGKICAPAYANILMAEFEQKYIYPLKKGKSILFLCYIAAIFMVWAIYEKRLKDFMNELN